MWKKILVFLISLLLLGLVALLVQPDFEKTSPTLYHNANILTVDDIMPTADAMLVIDGVIEQIGPEGEIETSGIDKLIKKDMGGATIMPGFIDVHTHFALSMFLSAMHDLSGFKHATNREVWGHLAQIAAAADPGEWIVCKGLDPILVPDLVVPSRQFLDSIAPDQAVVIFSQSLHSYWANSLAFEKVGITTSTPDPSELSYYEKDEAGHFTGLIVEQEAFRPFAEKLTQEVLTPKVLGRAARDVMDKYAQNGNTTIVSTGLTINDSKPLILLKHLSAEFPSFVGKLLANLGQLPSRKPTPRHFLYMRHDRSALLPEQKGERDDFYDILGIKHWYDGSPYIGSMYMDSSYLNTNLSTDVLHIPAGSKGSALLDKAALQSFIQQYHEAGWQIAIHTQGDAAIKEVISAYEELSQTLDFSQSRHRLEHCLLLPPNELLRVKALNLFPSYHINHIYYYGDALASGLLGEERTQQILPLKSSLQSGVISTLHADQPMFESRPFRLIQTAVERKTKNGKTIGLEEGIDVLEAIKCLTIYAAQQIHKEDKLGTLTKGKYADFIVLDRNPLTIPVKDIDQVQCRQTFIHGNKVSF